MTDDTLRRRAARFDIPNPVVPDVALEPVLDGAPGRAEIPRPSAPEARRDGRSRLTVLSITSITKPTVNPDLLTLINLANRLRTCFGIILMPR